MLSNNILAFLALSNEYCHAIETASESDKTEFVNKMLRILPRIYITVSDIPDPAVIAETSFIPGALDEDYYESMRRAMEALFGEDDTYLEVFEEDMKYSDTPIAASISESLADIFQELYNFLECVRDAHEDIILDSVDAVKEDFRSFWSQTLCNVLRPLNAIKNQL